ncbi:phage tail domain-containing protein [Brevibacterium oceani]|uniref:phage tail domain-containing protein n=1 Tax=Brevibacterium oceani TaxID=358099 RepID=UPI0015E724C7|nr:phage tail domain-containing protein [Brevibacterium oceani]
MDPFLKVFLRSSVGEIELSTHDHTAPFKLLDGARGFGLPSRSVESTPLPSANGSVFRSQRFDESEVMLPISVRGNDPSSVAFLARMLENVLRPASDDPIELAVEAPALGTVRRRFVYYTEGLEGAVGGSDSHFTWRHAQIKFLAPDPMWYGAEQVIEWKVDAGRKPFITSFDGPATIPFFPVMLASSTVAGAYQLQISGDANAWPVWEISGPGEDLLIENTGTEENIFIEGEFDEDVTVDHRPTVADIYTDTLIDGELWSRVNDDYSFFPLTPGLNSVKVTMVNARPNSVVRLRYSETWLTGW